MLNFTPYWGWGAAALGVPVILKLQKSHNRYRHQHAKSFNLLRAADNVRARRHDRVLTQITSHLINSNSIVRQYSKIAINAILLNTLITVSVTILLIAVLYCTKLPSDKFLINEYL